MRWCMWCVVKWFWKGGTPVHGRELVGRQKFRDFKACWSCDFGHFSSLELLPYLQIEKKKWTIASLSHLVALTTYLWGWWWTLGKYILTREQGSTLHRTVGVYRVCRFIGCPLILLCVQVNTLHFCLLPLAFLGTVALKGTPKCVKPLCIQMSQTARRTFVLMPSSEVSCQRLDLGQGWKLGYFNLCVSKSSSPFKRLAWWLKKMKIQDEFLLPSLMSPLWKLP